MTQRRSRFQRIVNDVVHSRPNGAGSAMTFFRLKIGSTISSRDEILECSHSFVDAAADIAIDRRLCVVVEEFNQK
jgi:hypothetical protein